MKFIKQTAWYGVPVTIAAIMAVALLFAGPAEKAEALTAGDATVLLNRNVATGSNSGTVLPTIITDAIIATNVNGIGDTIILTAPALWDFDTASTPTLTASTGALVVGAAVVLQDTVTWTATAANDGTPTLTMVGVSVIPETTATTAADIALSSAGDTAQISVADVATLTPKAAAGFTAGALTATASAGSLVSVISFIGNDTANSVFTIDGGSFVSNGATSVSCNDTNVTCDADGVPDQVTVRFVAPASGTVKVTVFAGDNTTADTALTLNVVSAASALAIKTGSPSNASIPAANGGGAATDHATITVTLKDADGNGIASKTVTVVTTLGFLEATAGTCDNDGNDAFTAAGATQSCTIATSGTGEVTVDLHGSGVSGSATLTFIQGALSTTATVTLVGTTDSATTSVNNFYVLAGTTNNVSTITVTALDTQGSIVGGETTLNGAVSAPTANKLVVDNTDCGAGTDTTKGQCDVVLTASATTAIGAHTVEIDLGTTLKATVTVNVVKAANSITTDAPASVDEGSTTKVTVTVLDEDGNPAPDGTTVAVAATGNAIIIGSTVTLNDGSGSFEVVATAGGGSAIIALSVGTVDTLLITITVGDVAPVVTPPAAGVATVMVAPPAAGFTQGVAGTDDFQALIDAQTFTVESIWMLDIATQVFQSYIPGGLAIANTLTSISATDIVLLRSQ